MLGPNGGRFFSAFMADFVEDPNQCLPVVGWNIPELREMEAAGRPELGFSNEPAQQQCDDMSHCSAGCARTVNGRPVGPSPMSR